MVKLNRDFIFSSILEKAEYYFLYDVSSVVIGPSFCYCHIISIILIVITFLLFALFLLLRRHKMKTLSALWYLWGGGGGGTGHRWIPLTKEEYDVLFCIILNNLSDLQSSCRWFETPWHPCDLTLMISTFCRAIGNPYYNLVWNHAMLWWNAVLAYINVL